MNKDDDDIIEIVRIIPDPSMKWTEELEIHPWGIIRTRVVTKGEFESLLKNMKSIKP